MALEVWAVTFPFPQRMARVARRYEDEGWSGIMLTDSQNLAGDVYSALTVCALNSERLLLGTGVTNPVTRHPAVTAGAAATIQHESGGRMVLGIGRGDSSLAYIGRDPAPVAALEDHLVRVQAYLAGTPVDVDGYSSRMPWVPGSQPKVPVDVAATGPKVLALGARLAERVTVAVGADPERVRWAVEVARASGPASLGAYVPVAVHDDLDVARRLVRGGLGVIAHFTSMPGAPLEVLADADRAVAERMRTDYDMSQHTRSTAPHAAFMDDAFVDRSAVAGPPAHCIERLQELVALGLERLVVIGPAPDAGREEARAAHTRFVEDVLPALTR